MEKSEDARLRILVSAYACEPVKGSEPGVGWNWVQELAKLHEVCVITRSNNRQAIEANLRTSPQQSLQFVYYDLPRWIRFWKKKQRGVRMYYYLWQIGALFAARRLHLQQSFDVAHHITFVSYIYPSFLALLGIPYVWGPVGGGESEPRIFRTTFGWRGKIYEFVRDLGRVRGRWDPLVRLTLRRAAAVVATTEMTAEGLRAMNYKEEIQILSLAAIPDSDINNLSSLPERTDAPFRVFAMGRLLHWKGYHLALSAFAAFNRRFPESEFWIIGDGPERSHLEQQARQLGIEDSVSFLGELPREEALHRIGECDVMLQPSLHDSSGWASAEAMAGGRPVVCLDLGGLALQVDQENGVKIPALDPDQAIRGMEEGLEALARDSKMRLHMGKAARNKAVNEFRWARKVAQINPLYQLLATTKTSSVKKKGSAVAGTVEKRESALYKTPLCADRRKS
jgi:glycosyltransferase involved in cell wall biosynthesis